MKIINNQDLNGKIVKRLSFVEDEKGLVTSVIIYFNDGSAFVVTGKELGFTPSEDITQLINRRQTGILLSPSEELPPGTTTL